MATNPSPSEGDLRYSLILSSLVLTPDAGLSELRRRRAGSEQLSIDRLRRAREHVRRIAQAVVEPSEDAWEAIEAAFDAIDAPRPRPPAAPAASLPSAPESAAVAGVAIVRPVLPVPPAAVPGPDKSSPWAAHIPPAPAADVMPVVGEPPPAPAARDENNPERSVHIDVDETAFLPVIDDLDDPLPFVSEPGKPPPAPAADPTQDRSWGTLAFGRVDMSVNSTLPFVALPLEADVSDHPASMTLDRYAALCAELSINPEESHTDVARRYGLHSSADRQRLDEAWRKALETDSALRSAFLERCQAHRKRLNRGP